MPGRYCADVVFCLDASGSMGPCFDALRRQIGCFVDGLRNGGQQDWDLRFDFLAHRAGEKDGRAVHHFQSLRKEGMDLLSGLYQCSDQPSGFFTKSVDEFIRGLAEIKAYGDEASLVALDACLHFPWRDAVNCHRVVILLTDEALETGVCVSEQTREIDSLIGKLHTLRVKLFLVGPESAGFDAVCAADRSEYLVIDDGQSGLASVELGEVLETMGKSVSVSLVQNTPADRVATRGLFGQDTWHPLAANINEK